MVYHDMASYLWVKGQTYYFNRRVPKDVQVFCGCVQDSLMEGLPIKELFGVGRLYVHGV